jgi:uncharacterized protein (DUF433 family)
MATLTIEHIREDAQGRPAIAGTRLRVTDVALWHQGGMSVAEMVENFSLTPGQAHAALSYYYDHRDEIDALIRQEVDHAAEFRAGGNAVDVAALKARIQARRGE